MTPPNPQAPSLRPPRNRVRASALIAVLWVISILSLAVFSATQLLLAGLEADASGGGAFEAELLADRGIAIASHPAVERGDPVLVGQLPGSGSYETRISSEGARLPINELLENAEDDRIVLEELFYQWGLRSNEAMEVVDNLIDWVDDDDEPTGRGAENRFYFSQGRLNHPFNRPFRSLEEMTLVHRFDLVMAANPNWRDAFTIYGSGQLDLSEAPPELIAAACLVPLETARLFVVSRDGYDGIPGTDDDLPLESLEVAFASLNPPQQFIEQIEARVTVSDPVKRIVSIGRFGEIAVERTAIVSYTGQEARILRWTTRRL